MDVDAKRRGVKLNMWTSTRKKINYNKREMFKILIFININIPNS